ncbi:MAG: hypothetical protein LBE25_05625 [Arthrobacter sp.]|nr:hypothetical protein [Arthrobacter sp.]
MRIELSQNEAVVVRSRPHPRGLLGPAWALIALTGVAGLGQGIVSRFPELGGGWEQAAPFVSGGLWVLLGLACFAWVLRPLWRWLRRRYVITTQRVISFEGRRRRDLPLGMITGVDPRPGVGAGRDGAGTLVLFTARGQASLKHVPSVRQAADVVRRCHAALPWEQPPGPYGPA